MWLPTKAQVDAASRHAISIGGTAVLIFGLQAKGFSLDQFKDLVGALGSTVNDVVILLGTLAPVYAALKASHTASPISQAVAVAASGAVVVASPEIAKATPDSPRIVSSAEVKVVSK